MISPSLSSYIVCRPHNSPFSQRQKTIFAMDVARGMWYLHGKGMLHLDLKTANVMLDGLLVGQHEAPRAVIVDFGMAAVKQPGENYAPLDTSE